MKNFDFIRNEHETLERWKAVNLFPKMVEKNANSGQRYRHLDGPITANGSMCMHHVWGRTLKDAMTKYHHLKGRSQQFQNGFDAQGMWVEVEVEKLLGLNDKRGITEFGLDKFTEKCIERVNHFADMQTRQSIRLGQIMDWDNSYFTNSDENITSIWYFLKVCHEKGLLKKSYKAMPWCPRCGTSLSEHEMNGSYREYTHRAVFAKLPLVGTKGKESEKILIWTTTPWTLPANVAVAVNPNDTYLRVRVKSDDALIIVGKDALKKLHTDVIQVVSEISGKKLVGLEYQRPLNLVKGGASIGQIISWTDVSASEGSGAVHIAPGCGAEDFELSKIHNLEPIIPVDEAGIFKAEFAGLAGLNTDEAEPVVFDTLTKNGSMYYTHEYTHNYPFCWRCKTNVVFKLVDGWDIATEPVKPAIFKAIKTIKWNPPYLQKMMEDWITNMGDWNISRRRFYGLPLPFYPCDCGELHVMGSLDELRKLAVDPKMVDNLPHLHRPYIDEIKIKCGKCKKPLARVADVGDCWLDAGITPFSTKKYFTDRKYWEANFPMDVVIEMKEQIRLWFYSMLFMSVVITGRAPWRECVGYNTMLDENGKKFSKTGPNNIKFDDAAEQYGADSMRYVFASSNPALDMRFGPSMIDEARRKLLSFLNTVTFFNTYAEIDRPRVAEHTPKNLDITDIWLVEALNHYLAEADAAYADHKIHNMVAATERFVEDLSNFYIRTNRRRFWKGERGLDKDNAYWALFQAIKTVTIVMAPVTPFMSEFIWQNMIRPVDTLAPESVLLADFPTKIKLDKTIKNITKMVEFIKSATTLAHSLRAKEGLKVRQPLRTMYIKSDNAEAVKLFEDYLKEELNVKAIEQITSDDQFNTPYLTVNFKAAGKVLGQKSQELKQKLESMTDAEMTAAVKKFDAGKSPITGKNITAEMFTKKLRSKSEFVSETMDGLTIVLDTTLDNELIEQGRLRDIIRSIQLARQEAGLDITTRIELSLKTKSASLAQAIENNADKICTETLAKSITPNLANPTHKSEAEIDGESLTIAFKAV